MQSSSSDSDDKLSDEDYKPPQAKKLVDKLFPKNRTRSYRASTSVENSPQPNNNLSVTYSQESQSCSFADTLPDYESTPQVVTEYADDRIELVRNERFESAASELDTSSLYEELLEGSEGEEVELVSTDPRLENWSVSEPDSTEETGSTVETDSESRSEVGAENMAGDMQALKTALEDIAASNKRNDLRLLAECPYFGETTDTSGKTWVVDSATEFLEHITKATSADTWNDVGKISVLRSKLLGSARTYFNTFSGDTFAAAKEYLLDMYPDSDTYASITNEIAKVRRNKGETLSALAIRIDELHKRLKTVAGNTLTAEAIGLMKRELLLKSVPANARNFVLSTDDYNAVLKKLLTYFEQNPQHKMTKADIKAEVESGVKGISAVGKEGKGQPRNKKGNDAAPGKPDNAAVAAIGQEKNPTGNTQQQANQKGATPKEKSIGNQSSGNRQSGGYRGRNYGRGQGRGRGRERGRGYDRGNYNRSYDGGNYQGGYNGSSDGDRGYSRENTQNIHRGMQCYKCNRWNHIARYCRANTQRSGQAANVARNDHPTTTCERCNLPNHVAANCLQPSQGF